MSDPSVQRLFFIYVVLLGACLGSFANVVIARLPHGLSLVKPRSRCPHCGYTLTWYDNIPLFSYLWLRGRCRSCRKGISLRYPLVEVLTAGVCGALYNRFGMSWDLLLWMPLATALIAIPFLDIDHWWVPDVITFPAMLWAFVGAFLPDRLGPVEALLGLIPALMVLAVGWLFERLSGKEGMGLGDVKLLAVLGLALGPMQCFAGLLLAALEGSVVGTLVILSGGHKSAAEPMPQDPDDPWEPHPHAVPFGPFLALGAFQVVLLPDLIAWWHATMNAVVMRWLQ